MRAGRSALPIEAEWERAVRHPSYVGQIWEWSPPASSRTPVPSFPFDGYSKVFFGTGRYRCSGLFVATHGKVGRHTFRNWDIPVRRQIFAGLQLAHDV